MLQITPRQPTPISWENSVNMFYSFPTDQRTFQDEFDKIVEEKGNKIAYNLEKRKNWYFLTLVYHLYNVSSDSEGSLCLNKDRLYIVFIDILHMIKLSQ